MGFLDNFLLPLIQMVIFLAVIILFTIGSYFFLMTYFKKPLFAIKIFLKYKLFRIKYNENIVAWAMDMLEREIPEEHLMKEFYLTNKFKLGGFDEGVYVYNQLKKSERG